MKTYQAHLTYDRKANAWYVALPLKRKKTRTVRTLTSNNQINWDLDQKGNVVGIEILESLWLESGAKGEGYVQP